MSVDIIDRTGPEHKHTTYRAYGTLRPQISYNSEGRIAIRIPLGTADTDTLIVLDRPLTVSLIRFVKNGIMEMPTAQGYCKDCAAKLNERDMPF